jgi:hypothetical protein
MTTDPSTVDFPSGYVVAVFMKALSSLLKNHAHAEVTNSAANGWTTQSARNPIGCVSKVPVGRWPVQVNCPGVEGTHRSATVNNMRIRQGGNKLSVGSTLNY